MKDTYAQLMSLLTPQEPSDKASFAIMARVRRAEASRLRFRAWAFGAAAFAAIFAFIPLVVAAGSALAQSGFYQYASLIVSDGAYAFANWKDLMLSMADALPVTTLSFCFASLLVFIAAAKGSLRYRSSLLTQTI